MCINIEYTYGMYIKGRVHILSNIDMADIILKGHIFVDG